MKDMVGIELEEGQHVFYFCAGPGGMVHEEAKVILARTKSIRVEFFGNWRGKFFTFGRKKGEQTNIFNTIGKIYVLCKHVELERLALTEQISDLTEENMRLKAEVDKIHYRFEILDL